MDSPRKKSNLGDIVRANRRPDLRGESHKHGKKVDITGETMLWQNNKSGKKKKSNEFYRNLGLITTCDS